MRARQDLNRLYGAMLNPQANMLPRTGQGLPAGMPAAPKQQPFLPNPMSLQQPLQQSQATPEALQQLRMTINQTAQLQILEALLQNQNMGVDGLAALGAALNNQSQAQAGLLGWQAAQQAQGRPATLRQWRAAQRYAQHLPRMIAGQGGACHSLLGCPWQLQNPGCLQCRDSTAAPV